MKVKVSWFSVNDFEGAKKFYGQVLGLKKTFEAQQWAEFAGAEGEESIGVAVNPHAGKEPGATVVLQVGDIEHERKRLETAGVQVRRQDRGNSGHRETDDVSRSFGQPAAAGAAADAVLAPLWLWLIPFSFGK